MDLITGIILSLGGFLMLMVLIPEFGVLVMMLLFAAAFGLLVAWLTNPLFGVVMGISFALYGVQAVRN